MGLLTIPAPAGLTRNVVRFTSSQTWTVPSTAQYVDVLVVGGGTGGRGGFRSTQNCQMAGYGGGVTIARNIYLGGTGTVSITIGAGTNGTAGATTTQPSNTGNAGFSAFGTFVYSQGSQQSSTGKPGAPGYKGTAGLPALNNDTDQTNYAPVMVFTPVNGTASFSSGTGDQSHILASGMDTFGLRGGYGGAEFNGGGSTPNTMGTHPGDNATLGDNNNARTNPRIPFDFYNTRSLLGAAGAGTAGTSGGAAGAAGLAGYGGGGGTCTGIAGQSAGQGGAGAGGGGSWPNPVGGNGGNGGNAGTNTGAGGGAGANTGSSSAGTGGNGGNGASGIVVVSWLG
jgi:hypothetical protein